MMSLVIGLAGLICGAVVGLQVAKRRSGAGELSAVLRRAASGDLTVRAGQGVPEELGTPLNAVLEKAGRVRAAALEAADRLAAQRQQISAMRDRVAKAAEESARSSAGIEAKAAGVCADVSTVSAGASELGASIDEISRNAAEALSVAGNAAKMSAQTTQLMTKLGDSSAQIGDVVQVITQIAEQTNLLALNATIEAARAGEMGKGFAVVASEVKDLAQETAKATKNITEQITAIQQDTGGAVEAIRQVTGVIERINSYQATISGAVQQQSATTREITRGIAEAGSHASAISTAVNAAAQRGRGANAEIQQLDGLLGAVSAAQTELRRTL